MDPDHLQRAWQAQPAPARLTIDAESLLKEVRRNRGYLAALLFWRDFREVGICFVMVPLWLYLGIKNSLPWTWYLTIPASFWVAGFLLADRMRHGARPPGPGEPLRRCVEGSLAQVEHQIKLLRGVLWWYLMPLALPFLAFVGQVAWEMRAGGWWTVLASSGVIAPGLIVFAGVRWLNELAVRSELEPRRLELEALLGSLGEEAPDAA